MYNIVHAENIPSKVAAFRKIFRYSSALLLLVCMITIGARGQTTTNPSQPISQNPGPPDGSYLLSDFENINLYNGKAYFNLPLLKVTGRGNASYTINLPLKPRDFFTVQSPVGVIPLTEFKPSDHFVPGRLILRGGSDVIGFTVINIVTRAVFTTSDGSQHELVDKLTGGRPNTSVGLNRGREFVSTDGSAMTFLSDLDVNDIFNGEVGATGFLMLADGTRYRFDAGRLSWICDRNGNKISFTYTTPPYTPNPSDPGYVTSTITDSLNRQIRFEYDVQDIAPYGKCDRIIYHGFSGLERIIRISKNSLGSSLRAGYSRQPYNVLFEFVAGEDLFDPEIISAVWLPNGRSYRLLYNPYAELARVELPTSGAIEYDYASIWNFLDSERLSHRLTQRRTYKPELEGKTTYNTVSNSANPSADSTVTVTIDRFTPGNPDVLVNREKHYFFSPNAGGQLWQPGGYRPWKEGREYQTEHFGADGTTLLKRVKNEWRQRTNISWWPLAGNNYPTGTNAAYEPPNDPRIIETQTELTDVVPNLIAKQTFVYDDTVPFNNRSDVYEYDFGSGTVGALLRHTQTKFITSSTYTSATGVGAHIRNLPDEIWVYDGDEVKRAHTKFEYDAYVGTNHADLTPRVYISGLDPAFTSSYTTRGNTTATTRYLLNSNGQDAGSITSYSQYDVAGNVVKTIDGRGFATTVDFTDCFGGPDGDVTTPSAPQELSSVGQFSYAFPTVVTNTANHIDRSQFDYYLGRAVNTQDPNGTIFATYFDDDLDRPKKVIRGFGTAAVQSQTTYNYDDAARIITTARDLHVNTDGGMVTKLLYDGLGRTTETQQYEGGTNYIAVKMEYDSMGRIFKQSNPYRPWKSETAIWTTTIYDALNRVIFTTTPDNAVVTVAYSGNRALLTDQAGMKRINVSNALGRLIEVWEITAADSYTESVSFPGSSSVAAGYRTKYEYNALDDLTKVTQRMGTSGTLQTRTFDYDSLKRLTAATNPENGTISYQYDGNGNVVVRTENARNFSTHYSYDELNRTTRRWYNGSSDINSTVNNNPALPSTVASTDEIKLFYDSQALPIEPPDFSRGSSTGRLVAQTYGTGSAGDYFGYDELGRQKLKVQRIGSISYELTRTYNAADFVASQKYPSNHTVTYNYDSAGRLGDKDVNNLAFSGNLGDGAPRTYSRGILYAAGGQLSQEQFGTTAAIYNKLNYNSRQQLAEILASTTVGDTWDRGKILNQYSLQCSGATCNATDNNGNIRKQEVYIPAIDPLSSPTSWYQQYDYDELNRLKLVHEYTGNSSFDWHQEYVYDRWGNRKIHQTNTSPNIPKPNYGIDPVNNRLTAPLGQVIDYDPAGNLKTDTLAGAENRLYNAENRMASAGGGSSQYFYDGKGQRIRRIANAIETWHVYGFDDELVAEYSANGATNNPKKEYGYRNGQLLISADTGNAFVSPVFSDDFNDNSLNTNSWTVWYPGLTPTVTEQGQQLQMALAPNTAGYNGVYSNSTFSLTNRMVQVESLQPVSQAGWCENFLELELDANNYFMIQVGAGNMIFRSRVNGVNDQTSIPFDGTANRFWRIRHDQSANLIHFETSANDSVWLIRKSVTPGFSLSALRFHLLAGAYGTGNSSPGTAKYDNFKLLASSAGSTSLSVPNFSFETPVVGNGSFTYTPVGGSWTFAGGGGISGNNSPFTGVPSAAADGVQVAFLQGNGTVSQSISGFQSGTGYVITFSAIQRTNCCNTGGQDIGVYLDDVLMSSFHPNSAGYSEYSTPVFTTSTGTHTIKFAGLNPLGGDHTAFIDKVRITGSPSPGFGVQWLLADQIGTPRMVFAESGTLASVKRHDYLPFGEELITEGLRSNSGLGYAAADGLRQHFTSKERDTETGLDYFKARYYASAQGRFTSPDPTLLSVSASNPQTWNRYAYVMNNPLTYTDPLGLWALQVTLWYKIERYDERGNPVYARDARGNLIVDHVIVVATKTKEDDNAATLAQQFGLTGKDAERLAAAVGEQTSVQLQETTGEVKRIFQIINERLKEQQNHRGRGGPSNLTYADCSSTACKIAYPNENITGSNWTVGRADTLIQDRRLRSVSSDEARIGDIVRYADSGNNPKHFTTFIFRDDSGVPLVFSRSGSGGPFEIGKATEFQNQTYGTIRGRNSNESGYYRR